MLIAKKNLDGPAPSNAQEASWKLMYGFIFFLIYYTMETMIFWHLTNDVMFVSIFILSLIPSGNFALYYSKNIRIYKQHVKFLSIFYKKRTIIFNIIQKRMELIQFIEELKNQYLEKIDKYWFINSYLLGFLFFLWWLYFNMPKYIPLILLIVLSNAQDNIFHIEITNERDYPVFINETGDYNIKAGKTQRVLKVNGITNNSKMERIDWNTKNAFTWNDGTRS